MDFEKYDALNTIIIFGQYKGKPMGYVLSEEPSYLQWLLGIDTQEPLLSALEAIKEDIARAVEIEREYFYGAYAGFPDPIYD